MLTSTNTTMAPNTIPRHLVLAIHAATNSDAEQRKLADTTKAAHAERFGREIATIIYDGHTFWPAETYHQDFHLKNPVHYLSYRTGCGRDRRLKALWGMPGH